MSSFPSIRSQVTDNATSAETTHTVSLPATINAGDIILVAIRVPVAGAIGWPDATWNELFDDSPDGSDDQQAAAWKLATGTEGGTTISVTSASGKFISIAIAVKDASDPRIIPPFVGTPGTGTTPNEPDPGDCNPATGAKDYLWWTAYSMEGEQTGITAYPSNYTLNQSGIVTTGTGGVTSTNCTGASAARQLNAASENAGAWDVTGTLINWTARTVAFAPAYPPGQQIAPDNIPRKASLGLAGLTIAISLLQSTLAPVAEVNYQDQEVILRARPTATIGQLTIAQGRPQYYQDPLPDGKISNVNPVLRVTRANVGSVEIGPHYYSLPGGKSISTELPLPKKAPALTWINDNQNNVLVPTAAPFYQTDWPNPSPIKSQIIITTDTRPQEDADIAFNQSDWPNPAPARIIAKSHLYSTQLEAPPSPPFIPVDYPNPQYKGIRNTGFTQARPSYYQVIEPIPVGGTSNLQFLFKGIQNRGTVNPRPTYYEEPPPPSNSSCPITLGIGAPGDITCFTLIGLEANPTSSIETGSLQVTENPAYRRRTALSWIQTRQFYYEDIKPNAAQVTVTPIRAQRHPNVGFIHSKPLYYVEPSAIISNRPWTWPNPVAKGRIRQGWTDHYIFDPTPAPQETKPSYTFEVLIPGKRPIRSYAGWIDYRTFDQNVPAQPTQNVWNNPVRKRVAGQTWLSPAVSSTLAFRPVGTILSELPKVTKNAALTWTYVANSLTVPLPNGQQVFDNPLLAKQLRLSWIQNRPFYYDEPLPTSQPNWSLPIVGAKQNTGWINTFLPSEEPRATYDLSLPVLPVKPALTWTNNNLQDVLAPPAEAAPFYQTEWPNPAPARAKRQDWIQSTQATSEQEKPFNQNDWPVFQRLTGKTQHWIWNRSLLEETPFVGSTFDVPLRAKVIAQTWINNSQSSTLNPLPFTSQTKQDWPNPLRGGRNQVGWNYSIVHLFAGETPVIRFIDYPTPRRFRRGQDWIYNSLIDLTTPVGQVPFNQTNWPVFRRVPRNQTTWISPPGLGLPQVVGRSICLSSNATEYYLYSEYLEYELESDATNYNFDSGGTECQ